MTNRLPNHGMECSKCGKPVLERHNRMRTSRKYNMWRHYECLDLWRQEDFRAACNSIGNYPMGRYAGPAVDASEDERRLKAQINDHVVELKHLVKEQNRKPEPRRLILGRKW